MIKFLIKSLFSATAKDSAVLLFGAVLATIFGFVWITILTRNLNPGDFGLIITALSITLLLVDLFELGINPAVLNYVSSAPENMKDRYIKVSFLAKIFLSSFLSVAIFLLAPVISVVILKSEAITPYIRISALGVFLSILIGWGQFVFQAKKMFLLSSLQNVSINLFRFLIILGLLLAGIKNAQMIYLMMQISLILSVVLLFLTLNMSFLQAKINFNDLKTLFKFGLPVGLGFCLSAVYTKLDQIFIFNLGGEVEAGVYGLAFKVASIFLFAAAAFNSAIAPRFASIRRSDFLAYFKKTFLASLVLGVLAFFTVPLSSYFIPLVFGKSFYGAVLPFQILTIGMTIFLISSVMNTAILYQFKKTKFIFFVSAVSLLLVILFLNFLIPLYKSVGAALAVTLVYLVQLVIYSIYLLPKLK